jgi:hypothetical protein
MTLHLVITNLRTHDGTAYRLVQTDDETILSTNHYLTRKFPTLAKALSSLGGMVDWDAWTAESREELNQLNNGRGAI